MKPIELRNELLANKVIKSLSTRHIDGYYCATSSEAINKVLTLMPKGSSVSWGGSMTIRDMGLIEQGFGTNTRRSTSHISTSFWRRLLFK